ncbi:PKD domain-containing protein [Nocardioides insulae]|uniref:PKD domain-containing protein n=1 Tax=Nocardioides insulae TaxID=394734 RepID=UPI0004056133|nr:PKD domain-containing protein [Nocardioides insulae]
MSWKKLAAVPLAVTLAVAGLGIANGPASADWSPEDPADPGSPVTVTADALPTVQIGDGVVWSQAVRGNIVYAGGEFATAQDPGGAEETRANMLAYDITTGLMTDFAPTFNGPVNAVAVSPDGTRLYVGGNFTQVNGQAHNRLAAFDLPSGVLVNANIQISGNVQALAVTDDLVYIGGGFGSVGNQTRGNLAAVNENLELQPWAPIANLGGGGVESLAVKPDGTRIAVGGSFLKAIGEPDVAEPGDGLALFDQNGVAQPLPAGENLYNGNGDGDADGSIAALAADDDGFYGVGWTYSSIDAGTVEGTFAVNWDGTTQWVADCHGDSYSVFPSDEQVYVAGHSHYCENMGGVTQGTGGVGSYPYYRGVAYSKATTGTATWEPDQGRYYNFEGLPTPSLLTWYPSINAGTFTGQDQGAWSVTGTDDYVVMGGEFSRVNNADHRGLVRFARSSLAEAELDEGLAEGPSKFAASYPLQVHSTEPGIVRVGWATNDDIDNAYLRYRLQRRVPGGNSELLDEWDRRADFWNPLGMTYTDTDVDEGAAYEYRIQARDPGGLTANSAWTPVTVAASGAVSAYTEAVHGDEPTHWWRFGEAAGSADPVADWVSSDSLTAGAGVTRGTQGAIGDDAANVGATFSGSATGVATTTGEDKSPPDLFTLEAWFRTTSTTGGRIVGRDNGSTRSVRGDRVLYIDGAGKVGFGVKPNATMATLSSPGGFNDGAWHHVAGVLSGDGMKLYVDGELAGQNGDVTVGEHLAVGFWRVGGSSTTTGVASGFTGDIDEVALYKHALSGAQITEHAEAAGEVAPNQAPTAAIAVPTVKGLAATFNGAGSKDLDGNVARYVWSFGDGETLTTTTPTASHTYLNGGTYEVGLVVVDNAQRASAQTVRSVQVVDPTNKAPKADFAATVETRPRLDASTASTDSDGTIVSWLWDFGNGEDSTSSRPRPDFAPLTKNRVKLTVTDNDGATGTIVRDVTVSADGALVLSAPVLPPPANRKPVAAFGLARSGFKVTLTSRASDPDGKVASVRWSFGDGASATGNKVTHSYTRAGTFQVRMTVTDDKGATATRTQTLKIAKVGVRADLKATPKRVRRGKQVTLVANLRPSASVALRGTVTVKDRGRVVRKIQVRSQSVRLVVRPSLGTHRYQVVYSGSPTTMSSASKVVVVRVRR